MTPGREGFVEFCEIEYGLTPRQQKELEADLDALLAAEREACAKIVEDHVVQYCHDYADTCKTHCDMYGCSSLREIAAAIRGGKE